MTIECSNCGAQMEEDIKFCTECGSKMEPPEAEELKCPNCSAQLPKGTKFCTECGTNTEIQETKKEIVCPKCSKKLPVNTKFCTDCGTKIGQPVSKIKTHDDPIDETIESLKDTGKDLMKEAGSLFKKFR